MLKRYRGGTRPSFRLARLPGIIKRVEDMGGTAEEYHYANRKTGAYIEIDVLGDEMVHKYFQESTGLKVKSKGKTT